MRDARSGGGEKKRVRVRQRPAAQRVDPLNHRQQQIVHQARELVQARPGSKQKRDAAAALARMKLNEHEHRLANRAAHQHLVHLESMNRAAGMGPSAQPARLHDPGHEVVTRMPFALPGLSHDIHYRTPARDSHGKNADLGDLMLRQAGIRDALEKTQMSPVLRGLRTATQDIIGPSITAYAHGEHASKAGLAGDVAMLIDPTKITRGAHAALEAARAGEGAVDVLRAAKGATRESVAGAKALNKFKRTPEGKQAVADLKAHPVRAEVHRQIEIHPELKPVEKRNLKRHFDNAALDASRQSGRPVPDLLADPHVQPHAAAVTYRTPEEVVANRIRPRNPGHEGRAPVGEADPVLRAKVATALETHGVDTSVFRQADMDPNKFADLISRGEPGRFWYEQSGKDILAAAHGNKEIADKIAQLLAVYSAQRAPVENTQLAVNAFHEWQRTGKVSSFGTGPQIEKANQILVEGKPWEGLKTDRFYGNLLEEIDPEKYAAMFPGGEVTNDIWMARLFGLKTDNPTTREYHAMTGIVQRIADELGWKPKQVQAALWVAKKAEHEGTSVQQAAIDFSTAIRAESAHLPFEAAPGVDFAPALAEQYAKLTPEAQRAYTAAKADLVNQFLDEVGIFGRLGHEGVGVYEGQFNPGWTILMPASRGQGKAYDLAVAPLAREELDAVSSAIGQAFHQDAAAWFKPFYKKSTAPAHRNGVKAILDRSMTSEEAIALDERFRAAGHDVAIIHDHDGVHFLNLDSEALPNRNFHAAVGEVIDSTFGPETRSLLYAADTNYITKEGYSAHLGGNAGGRSDVLGAAAVRLEERGAAIDKQFLSEGGPAAVPRTRRSDGLSSGIDPGLHDDSEHGLIGDWFKRLRDKSGEPAPAAPDPNLEQDISALDKAQEGLKGAQTTRRAQDALRREEVQRRTGLAEEAMRGAQGLEEKLRAAKTELEGALPKLEHQGIRGLSEAEADRVGELIEAHPDLRFYERLRAMDAFRNAWATGQVPTKSELRLLRKALGPNVTTATFNQKSLHKVARAAFEVTNMPRSLMASFDVSAPFRQGLVAFARHPILSSKNLGPMLKYFGSEHGYQDLMRSIDHRPNRDLYAKADLAITDVEHSLEHREEQFMSNLAEKLNVPVGGGHSVGPGHVVRMSGRAYTGFLVKTRADMFDHLVEVAQKMGHDVEDPKFLKDLGAYINAATGRGNLGKLEGAAVALNSTFFSPRLIASRLTFLYPPSYVGLHPFVRRQKLRAALQLAGAVGAVLWLGKMGGAKVGLDPFSADFGKLRFGDTRVDISGGFAGYLRVLGTVGMATTGHDPDKKTMDTLTRFWRGKLAPIPGFGLDIATHTDYSGYRSPDLPAEVRNLFTPLLVQDTIKVIQNKDTLPKVIGTAAASAVGFGVNTYKDSTPKGGGKSKAEKESDFTAAYQKKFGRPLPTQVAMAQRTKDMYASAEQRRKDELGVSTMTDEQRTYVKLAVLAQVQPNLRPAIRNYRSLLDQQANPEVTSVINGWAEEQLGWPMLEEFHGLVKP